MRAIITSLRAAVAVAAVLAASPTWAQPSAPSASVRTADDYRLDAGDRLRIIVFGEENLSGEFAVSGSGDVAFPLVGAVPAAGRTIAELQEAIRVRLADGYLRDPRVSAEVLTYRPFFILGEVQKPGEYSYRNGLTILNAVATAGGFTYRANKKRVLVRKAGDGQEQEVRLRADTPLSPGDTIVVRERFF
ncbi:polysaccharide biosynthesis/export family protein [Phenylobacterium sp.]|uniref:polysaccharide biosynthesis/export family protein n=1 Tax=Phenylobacterium sp. TaxID=1871053 RepID=UPI0035B3E7CF